MQDLGRARIVGEPSCGCLLAYLGYANIPGGGELAYSEVGFVTPKGRRIEGAGVMPDKLVPLTQAGSSGIARSRTGSGAGNAQGGSGEE